MGAACGGLVVTSPARVGNDVRGIGGTLVHDQVREQVAKFRDAQGGVPRPRRGPFFWGRCRARSAASTAKA